MVSPESCGHAGGAPGVAPRPELRVFVSQLQREGLQRHRAATWPNSARVCSRIPEATFNRTLKILFILLLFSGLVLNVIIFAPALSPNASPWSLVWDQTWLFGRAGVPPLALFASGIAIALFVKRTAKNGGSAPARGGSVISAAVEHV